MKTKRQTDHGPGASGGASGGSPNGANQPPTPSNPAAARRSFPLLRRLLRGLALLALAVGLHALLFLSADVTPTAPTSPMTKQTGQSILLPPSITEGDMPERLHTYARIFDPTTLVKPRQDRGFSSTLSRKRRMPATPPPELATLTDLTAERALPQPTLTPAPEALAALVQANWTPPTPLPLDVPPPQAVPETTLWRTDSGAPIDGLPNHTPDEIRTIAGDAQPTRPTTIRIENAPAGLRLRVVASSGVRPLDELAIRDLRTILRPILMAPDGRSNRAETIPEALQPPPKGDAVVEAEWRMRLAQAPTENAND